MLQSASEPPLFAETVGNQCRPATAPLSWVGGCLTNWKEISKSVAILLYFSKRFDRFIKQNNIHFLAFKKMKNSFQGFIDIEREQLLLKEKPQLLLRQDIILMQMMYASASVPRSMDERLTCCL